PFARITSVCSSQVSSLGTGGGLARTAGSPTAPSCHRSEREALPHQPRAGFPVPGHRDPLGARSLDRHRLRRHESPVRVALDLEPHAAPPGAVGSPAPGGDDSGVVVLGGRSARVA
ncbi:unnamed protein product, partial [Musa acuminata subsp. burmannicoides]